jgi:hypothetical protein
LDERCCRTDWFFILRHRSSVKEIDEGCESIWIAFFNVLFSGLAVVSLEANFTDHRPSLRL